MPEKPQCCEDSMSFVMDNKVKELFECQSCGKMVVRDKRTGEEQWYTEIFSPHILMSRFPHLFHD